MVAYIHNNYFVAIWGQIRAKLALANSHPALAIYDSFKAQFTPRVLNMLDSNNIYNC